MKELRTEDLETSNDVIPYESILKKCIEIILSSINDWPESIDSINDFEKQIQIFIGGEVNERTIQSFLSNLSRQQISKQAWQIEALTELVEIFSYYPNNTSLEEIILNIQKQIENYNPQQSL